MNFGEFDLSLCIAPHLSDKPARALAILVLSRLERNSLGLNSLAAG